MGVTTCARKGCENNGTKRYSSYYGCICDKCFDELVTQWGEAADIIDFLETEKRFVNEKAARARFEIEFPLRD